MDALVLLKRGHLHHIRFRSRGGETDPANLVTLCAGCHAEQHAGRFDVRGSARAGIEVWHPDDDGTWYLVKREIMPHVWERD